jgi:hypothetical protein
MATLAMGVPLLGEEGFWKVPGWNGYYVYMCQGHACTARHGWRRVTRYAYTSRGDLKPDGHASGTGRIYCPSCAQELGLPMRQDALERDINDSTWITVTPEMLRAHLAQTSPMCLRSPAPTPWAILDAPAAQASPALQRTVTFVPDAADVPGVPAAPAAAPTTVPTSLGEPPAAARVTWWAPSSGVPPAPLCDPPPCPARSARSASASTASPSPPVKAAPTAIWPHLARLEEVERRVQRLETAMPMIGDALATLRDRLETLGRHFPS